MRNTLLGPEPETDLEFIELYTREQRRAMANEKEPCILVEKNRQAHKIFRRRLFARFQIVAACASSSDAAHVCKGVKGMLCINPNHGYVATEYENRGIDTRKRRCNQSDSESSLLESLFA